MYYVSAYSVDERVIKTQSSSSSSSSWCYYHHHHHHHYYACTQMCFYNDTIYDSHSRIDALIQCSHIHTT